jgi:hypothetical protein
MRALFYNYLLLRLIAVTVWTVVFSFSIFKYIDPQAKPDLDSFLSDGKARGLHIDDSILGEVVFVDLGEDILGVCVKNPLIDNVPNSRRILLNNALRQDMAMLKVVIYHEAGHCILNKEHENDGLKIMNTYLDNPDTFFLDWEKHLNTLFAA